MSARALPAQFDGNVLRRCSWCRHQLSELLQGFVSSARGLRAGDDWKVLMTGARMPGAGAALP